MQRRRLQRLLEAADRLHLLVDDVLDLVRPDHGGRPGGELAVSWAAHGPAPAASASGPDRGPILVYVAPDGAHVALMAELVDEVGGGELLAATTLDHGVAAARAARAHLVLIDLDAPGMVERDPSAVVRQAWPDGAVAVVGVTAPGAMRAHPRRLLAGFDRLLHRPITVDDLARLLAELVRQRS